jgi:UDP-2,4-diacetamido-2,4,6-trideoxy-beta-L-altropyranose hydrolase
VISVAFRVDASVEIGTGHFVRCLTLADKLAERGAKTRFICRHLPSHLHDLLITGRHELKLISSPTLQVLGGDLPHSKWLETTQESDAQDTVEMLSDEKWDWLVVDHYALDARWESKVRQVARGLAVIDDLADRTHDCDVLLDQNFYNDQDKRYDGKVPAECQMLLGPQYALLRDEFSKIRETTRERSGAVRRLLIFFGGVDIGNLTAQAIEAISSIENPDWNVDVVIGAQHPNRDQIQVECERHHFTCYVQTNRMADLMASADLSIGAGGSATWERCCLGLPTLAVCAVHNQDQQISDAAECGLIYVPEIGQCLTHTIRTHVTAMVGNRYLRSLISKRCMEAVDGCGSSRVAKVLEHARVSGASNVTIRRAVARDAELVWPWRNNTVTRRYSFQSGPISIEEHDIWWSASIVDPKRVLLLGEVQGKAFGVVRYDFIHSLQAKVSIYINPEMAGAGLGKQLLNSGNDWFQRRYPEIEIVIAEIMPNNIASLCTFFAAGFTETHRILTWKAH